MRLPLRVAAVAVLVVAAARPGLAQDPAERGAKLARTWCAECHVLPGADQGSDAAPALAAALAGREVTAGALRAWLSTPHPRMPDFDLSRDQIDALVAYLRGLSS